MKVSKTPLADLLLVELRLHGDARGQFAETWRRDQYREAGITAEFVQDNFSISRRGVLRGLHFQCPLPQAKLVSVFRGSVFDVAVDLRKNSPSFGRWWGTELSHSNAWQLYIPAGFAHGFVVISDEALLHYKCSDYYHPETEHTLIWNDPQVGIRGPVDQPVISPKDAAGKTLAVWQATPESDLFKI